MLAVYHMEKDESINLLRLFSQSKKIPFHFGTRGICFGKEVENQVGVMWISQILIPWIIVPIGKLIVDFIGNTVMFAAFGCAFIRYARVFE